MLLGESEELHLTFQVDGVRPIYKLYDKWIPGLYKVEKLTHKLLWNVLLIVGADVFKFSTNLFSDIALDIIGSCFVSGICNRFTSVFIFSRANSKF